MALSRDGFLYLGVWFRKDISPSNYGYAIRLKDIPPGLLPKSTYWVDKPFHEAKIRDADSHYAMWESSEIPILISTRFFTEVTILVENSLDQNITINVQGSYTKDFVDAWEVCPAFTVEARVNDYRSYQFISPTLG